MDIARPDQARKKRIRRASYGLAALIGLVGISIGLSRLEPAPPSVDRATVWIDTVKRGSFTRQVRGAGTLVPEEIRWIPAATEGRVERIAVLAGSRVTAQTILLELSNAELELAADEAESELKSAEADLVNLRVQLQSQLLAQEAATAAAASDHRQAALRAEADAELAKAGLVAEITLRLARMRAEEFSNRAEIEGKRLAIASQAGDAQLAVQQAKLDRLRAAHRAGGRAARRPRRTGAARAAAR